MSRGHGDDDAPDALRDRRTDLEQLQPKCCNHAALELVVLVVDRDPERLEDERRRVMFPGREPSRFDSAKLSPCGTQVRLTRTTP